MKIDNDIKLTFDDVMIIPKRSTLKSRGDVNLKRKFTFKYSKFSWEGVPIIAANMDTIGTIQMANVLNQYDMLTALHKFHNVQDLKNHNFINSIITIGEGEIADHLLEADLYDKYKFLMVDVANGYRECFLEFIKLLRVKFPNKIIIAGNVATKEMTEALILAGADIIKIGIGPGAVCTTRKMTGVGYPQLSAISDCADAAHGLNAHIIADGGCKNPGDIAKAFGAGADFVMLGGMLAGHEECAGEIEETEGKAYKIFYGMSSTKAQTVHYDNIKEYRASEGKVVKIPYKGPVKNTIKEILGGLRSAHSYIGASNIKNFAKCCTFCRCTQITNEVFSNLT
jgi:GMP reductase